MRTEAIRLRKELSDAGLRPGAPRETRTITFLLPTLIVMFGISLLPTLTVVNYSLHVLLSGSIPHYFGLGNYVQLLRDENFVGALGRQFLFTFWVLVIELPLGVLLAMCLPEKGVWVGLILVLLGIPLLIPWNVVGIIWRIFTRPDIGVVTKVLERIGFTYNVGMIPTHAWWTVVFMDVWHWTPLVILLSYAGLRAIPQEFYQAARVDSASRLATFRYITLPKLKHVLIIAVLLRTMDSFRLYDEPFILTAGGPGSTTLFLSHFTTRQAIGSFDMGYGSAISVVYFFIVVLLCYVLYTAMMKVGEK